MRTTNTIKIVGVDYAPIKVECEITPGIGIHLVGLSDLAVKESLLRTVTAMQALGYRIPGKKIVVNFAPADLCKDGTAYDLALALSIIAESGQADVWAIESLVVVGELALSGYVRGVPGVVQAVQAAKDQGFGVIIPKENWPEVAELFGDYKPIYPVATLAEAVEVAAGALEPKSPELPDEPEPEGWWNRISGQNAAKRALEIAAAGGHDVFLMGAPGSGKAGLAKALLDILPPMSKDEQMEVAKVWSAAGKGMPIRRRPFRMPHVASSTAAWFGGGAGDRVRPGEVSLASRGVLYVDEFAEMPKAAKEFLRVPMEDGKVVVSRLKSKVEFPAHVQLVLGSLPCPCGYYGSEECKCTAGQRLAYLSKLSGPVMDRVDVQVWVHPSMDGAKSEPAARVAERVQLARELQMKRQGKLNADLGRGELPELSEEAQEFAERIVERLGLSARSWSRMIKIARTIADLEGVDEVLPSHIAEASSFRFLDRRIEE